MGKTYNGEKRTIGICRICGEHFDDYEGKQHRKYICKACFNHKSKMVSRKIASTLEGYFYLTMNGIKNTPRRKDYECDIDVAYLVKLYKLQKGKCAISGIEMTIGYDKDRANNSFRNPYNVSIDRVDSEKGYTKDNVILICGCINWLKNKMLNINDVYSIATEMHENKNRYVEIRELIDNMIVAESIVS